MVRNFSFKWYKNEKYGKKVLRTNSITVSNASSEVGEAAKAATDLFCKTFGNLKRNTIMSIQEYNEDGPVGEPIVPTDGSSIVPIGK